MWNDSDFRTIFSFLATMAEILRTDPGCVPEFSDLLRSDCADAHAALVKISDAVCANR